MIVAVPGAMPETTPLASTVATLGADVAHVRPDGAPASAPSVAVSVVVAPTSTDEVVVDGVMVRTIGVTVTAELPETPPAVAEIVAVPPPTAVMEADAPLPLTVATAGLLLCHEIVPVALLGESAAASEAELPTPVREILPGLTVTAVMAGGAAGPSPPPPQPVDVIIARAPTTRRRVASGRRRGRRIFETRNRHPNSLILRIFDRPHVIGAVGDSLHVC